MTDEQQPHEEPTAVTRPAAPVAAPDDGDEATAGPPATAPDAAAPAADDPGGPVADDPGGPAADDPGGPVADDPGGPAADDPGEVAAATAETGTAAGESGQTSSPDPVIPVTDAGPVPAGDAPSVPEKKPAPWQRLSSAGALIWVLLALLGFTLVVQLRSNDSDDQLATARQEDLVRILSDLEARDTRLQAEINALENSKRQLSSGVAGREAALAEAAKRADELGLLAGTLPGRGPGLVIELTGVKASAILNAVQELRGAGGEVMQLAGRDGAAVRVVASTSFVDAKGGGIAVDGARLTGPYTLSVIGVPQTMQTALQIPGGVVASVQSDGGSVTMEQRTSVDVTAVRQATNLQYARPVD